MKRILVLLPFFLVCIISGAQTPKEDSIKTEIIKLSGEWNQALVMRDSLTLERILSADFTLKSNNGSIVPRKEWMDNSVHGLRTEIAEFVADQIITVYGTEAISQTVLHWKVRNPDNSLRNMESAVGDIWRYTNGKWQVTHRMSKLIKKL